VKKQIYKKEKKRIRYMEEKKRIRYVWRKKNELGTFDFPGREKMAF